MEPGKNLETVTHTRLLSTHLTHRCDRCSRRINGAKLDEAINHYIESHGYALLHVGQQTSTGTDGRPFHAIVALVGK